MAKGNKHQGLPVVESSAMESEFQSYVDETAAKMFAMQGSISEVAKELSNLCTDLLSEMRAMFLELRAAPPPPNRSLEPDEAEPPPPEILTIEEPRQTPPEAQTQAGVRGKAPATISSPNSSTLGTSGINTNSVEGSTSSNSITSSNRVVTYRELGHGEVVLGLHNDLFSHLNDVPNSEPTGIGVIQPRVTAMVTTNTLYPSTMCGTLYPSTVNGTFVMDVMGGRTESGQCGHENSAGVNSGMYSSASAGFLMDPRGAPHLQHTNFSSHTGLPPFSQSSGSQFSQAIRTTPTSHFSVPNPAIFRAKENNQKMNSCEKNATYLSDEVLQSNWLCNVGKKMAVYRGIRDKGGGIKTHCDCNVSLMSTEGIGVKIDGRQGPYSCECHALKVFDEMPTSDVFCGRRVAALTSIRDKGGGLTTHCEFSNATHISEESFLQLPAKNIVADHLICKPSLVSDETLGLNDDIAVVKKYIEGTRKIKHYALQPCFSGFDKRVRDKGSGHHSLTCENFVLIQELTGNMRLLWCGSYIWCTLETLATMQKFEFKFNCQNVLQLLSFDMRVSIMEGTATSLDLLQHEYHTDLVDLEAIIPIPVALIQLHLSHEAVEICEELKMVTLASIIPGGLSVSLFKDICMAWSYLGALTHVQIRLRTTVIIVMDKSIDFVDATARFPYFNTYMSIDGVLLYEYPSSWLFESKLFRCALLTCSSELGKFLLATLLFDKGKRGGNLAVMLALLMRLLGRMQLIFSSDFRVLILQQQDHLLDTLEDKCFWQQGGILGSW